MDNSLHFEHAPYHHLCLKDRKTLDLTGIKNLPKLSELYLYSTMNKYYKDMLESGYQEFSISKLVDSVENFVEEVAEECTEYTEEQWEDVAEEFELLVKKAEKYQDLTVEEKMELATVQAKYAGLQAKKGIDKVIDGVKDLFGGKKDK